MRSFANEIRDGLDQALAEDPSVLVFGLGVPDPKGVFGTTLDLQEKYGEKRVFDMPTSENAMTGIAIGAALGGFKPVLTHQRLDFALLSMDQLVNNAAKWHFMFGGKRSVPITIRMILGRGWGQGPTHSQNLQSWFAHIPGLKVVMPALASDAKGLLLSSIFDPNPVIFLEHRWLHNAQTEAADTNRPIPLGEANLLREGDAVTVVSVSYMTIEALHAVDVLKEQGISCDLIDLRSISPIDWPKIEKSVKKTGKLLVLDTGFKSFGIAAEIMAHITETCFRDLTLPPARLTAPDYSESTSPALTKDYHIRAEHIAARIGEMTEREISTEPILNARNAAHDVPGNWFTGPF
ncbi:alpha-ketoacid dehydrogenase subunit beta [Sneathiella sp. HT1-7]|jgi:pyruvate dehydrogenase E1 component beta subunit|uniref:alpha-ketoacid dehydrogenase subunit beta n=1 Tax=Sneathiella sp. HT1-7 TaxID=2887192 RepID=UPI001D159A4E|nr:transketolase C-terminal domain-containing protein [Sneathiella sp. HT1-7]MCC3305338.1 alpha-ketoacid dehydrogenase subunit beta [Sneathiella sp. HT1-7]